MTTITRVTQNMLTQRSLTSVDGSLARMTAAQEQMTTGRRINRPSDDPAGAATAMRARAAIADQQQYQRNGQDGLARLGVADSTMQAMSGQLQRAYTLAVQGANTASASPESERALADEVDQIRKDLLASANTQYLGRPIFGGNTTNPQAYQDNGDGTVSYLGDNGDVLRRVGNDTTVTANVQGKDVFGDVNVAGDSVFEHLKALSDALTGVNTGGQPDSAGIETQIANLQKDIGRMSEAAAAEGARYNQISTANDTASAMVLSLQKTQSNVEDVDIAQATINVATQQTAYQAALAATSKTIQPSLLDFLR